MPSDLWRKELKKDQANDVMRAIQNEGLDPTDFEWIITGHHYSGSNFLRLLYEPSDHYFEFQETSKDGQTDIEFSPGQKHPVERRVIVGSGDIKVRCISEWLKLLKEELDIPDLWAAFYQNDYIMPGAISGASSDSEADNSPFTQEEQDKIAGRLDEIKEILIKTQKLNESQQQFLAGEVDYLKKASQRTTRIDWPNIVVGWAFGASLRIGLAPEAAQEVFRFTVNALRDFIGGLPPLLP